jgi:hypothetical protein
MTPDLQNSGDEAGVSVYTDLAHRIDMGVSTVNGTTQIFFRPLNVTQETSPAPQYQSLQNASAMVDFEIKALNQTTYSFSASSAGSTLLSAYASSAIVTVDFIGMQSYQTDNRLKANPPRPSPSGAFVGVFANGQNSSHAYFSNWSYVGDGQIRY